MEKQVVLRLKKGYKPTIKQCLWIKENIDRKFDRDCHHCMFNILNYFGLLHG